MSGDKTKEQKINVYNVASSQLNVAADRRWWRIKESGDTFLRCIIYSIKLVHTGQEKNPKKTILSWVIWVCFRLTVLLVVHCPCCILLEKINHEKQTNSLSVWWHYITLPFSSPIKPLVVVCGNSSAISHMENNLICAVGGDVTLVGVPRSGGWLRTNCITWELKSVLTDRACFQVVETQT